MSEKCAKIDLSMPVMENAKTKNAKMCATRGPELTLYESGAIALSDYPEGGDSFVYLYPEQLSALVMILNTRDKIKLDEKSGD